MHPSTRRFGRLPRPVESPLGERFELVEPAGNQGDLAEAHLFSLLGEHHDMGATFRMVAL